MAFSYLQGEALTWGKLQAGKSEVTLCEALKPHFNPLNKVQAARGVLHKRKPMTDFASYNKSFQAHTLKIPDITVAEQIDRYSGGIKSNIWEALCPQHYDTLDASMRDSLHVQVEKRGVHRVTDTDGAAAATNGHVPIYISIVHLGKIAPEERKRCMHEGLCLRCRAKSHMAKDYPKGRLN